MRKSNFLSLFFLGFSAVKVFAQSAVAATETFIEVPIILVYVGGAVILAAVLFSIFSKIDRKSQVKEEKTLPPKAENKPDLSDQDLLKINSQILALEDKFESLYDVELATGKYEIFIKGKNYNADIQSRLLEINEFFSDLRKDVELVIHPDDKKALLELMTREGIKKALENKPSADLFYRVMINEEPVWFKIRVVYKNEEKKNIIIGVFSAEEEIAKKKRDDKLRSELVNQVTGDDALFLIDCANDTRQTVHNHTYGTDNYKDSDRYTDLITRYIDKDVMPEDREKMRKATTVEYMMAQTINGKEYTVQYRDISTGNQLFYEMHIARFSDTEILQSFKENDKSILAKMIYDKIENEYFAVFSVDLDSGIAGIMKDGYGFVGKEGTVTAYTSLIKKIASDFEGETKEFLIKISDIEYLKKRFAKEDRSTFAYKSHFGHGSKWGNITGLVLTRHDDRTPSMFAIGFSFMDENANKKEKLQVKAKEAISIADGLANRYETIYSANLAEDTFSIYLLDGKKLPEVDSIVNNAGSPFEILHDYGQSELIHVDDRHLFTEMNMTMFKEKLAHNKSFSLKFRRMYKDGYHWVEMDVVKYEEVDEPANSLAIGFADVDIEIRSEQATRDCFSILAKDISPDESIDELLTTAGEFYGAERCYLFEYANERKIIQNTYEWCAKGVEPMISQLQAIPATEIEGWIKEFKRQGAFYMDALDVDGAYGSDEGREILEMQGIQSLIAAPIMSGDEIIGFIGVDNPTKAKKNIDIMRNVAVVAYNGILKRENITLLY